MSPPALDPPVLALVVGALVWAVIAAAAVAWLTVTTCWRPLPSARAVLRWLVTSWLGRAVSLAAWAGAGWHIFCQHP